MSDLEEKMPCSKCNGNGTVETLLYSSKEFKIICPKCVGKRKIDWIQSITGIKLDVLELLLRLYKKFIPDNYVFVFGGTAYFVRQKFFYAPVFTVEHIQMNVPFLKENPDELKVWR